MKEYITPAVKMYDASLRPCPFCGSVEQSVCGVLMDAGKWSWDVTCRTCRAHIGYYGTEQEALEAWKRRFTDHDNEVEEDGFKTWMHYWNRLRDELSEGIRRDGAD